MSQQAIQPYPMDSRPQPLAMILRGVATPMGLLAAALVGLAVLACHDAWLDIARIVRKDEEASHILLVPPIFLWLTWVRRARLNGWQAEPSAVGFLIVLPGALLWAFGYIRHMQVFWHLGAVLVAFGTFVSVCGLEIVRRLWPAFVVLIFLLPVPGVIRQPVALHMQNIAAQITQQAMMLLGYELNRSGNLLVFMGHPINIAEACNGMRMVSMLVLVAFAFVFVHAIRPWARVVLLLAAAPVAVACNVVRLVITVLAYGYSTAETAEAIHDVLGWVMVVLSYLILTGLLWLMRWLLLPVDDGSRQDNRPAIDVGRRRGRRRRWTLPAVPGTAAVALTGVGIAGVFVAGFWFPTGERAEGYHAAVREASEEIPRAVGAWQATDIEVPDAAVALLRPNVVLGRRYRNSQTGRTFELVFVQCLDARDMEGHFPPNCYPAAGWLAKGARTLSVDIGGIDAAGMTYQFARETGRRSTTLWVSNLMMVPSGEFSTTMAQIRRQAGTVRQRFFGAAQIQFVFEGRWSEEERQRAIAEVGPTFAPVLRIFLAGSDYQQLIDPAGASAVAHTTP